MAICHFAPGLKLSIKLGEVTLWVLVDAGPEFTAEETIGSSVELAVKDVEAEGIEEETVEESCAVVLAWE